MSIESAGRLLLAGIGSLTDFTMLYRQVRAARKASIPSYQLKAAATQTLIDQGLVRAFWYLEQGIRRSILYG